MIDYLSDFYAVVTAPLPVLLWIAALGAGGPVARRNEREVVTMAVEWDDLSTWGTHVHESEWGTWLPEKTRTK